MNNINERERLIKITQDLIKVNTCQPEGNEQELVNYITDIFKPFSDIIDMYPIDHGNNRGSLLIKINGEKEDGGIVFAGHLDTVSVGNINDWKYNPFDGYVENNILHGRGSVDMKSGVAAIIVLGLHILESKKTPKEPVYLCFTADEEQGGLGIKAMAETGLLKDITGVVIAEPTDKKIAISEKGALWLGIDFKGKLAHGSKPEEGINAIDYAIIFIERFKEYFNKDNIEDRHLGKSSMAVTKFDGGIMTNVIPYNASIEFDIRTLPHIDHHKLLDKAQDIIDDIIKDEPELKVEINILNNRPSVATKEDDEFVLHTRKSARDIDLNDKLCGMTYYTDAAQLIPVINKPFVIVGPGYEGHAHQLNEAVIIDDIEDMFLLYLSMVNNI